MGIPNRLRRDPSPNPLLQVPRHARSQAQLHNPGVEPFGCIDLGFAEIFVGTLLLIPRTAVLGAIAAIGLMVGAIGSHLAILGIEVQDDGGLLFSLAVAILIMGSIILLIRRREVPILGT